MQLFAPPAVSHYSFFVDDSGYPIHSFFVDYRNPEDRTPITTLVKRCNKEFAFELCGTICISKPGKYQHHGESLVNDPTEGKPTRIIEESESTIDPDDVARAKTRDDEYNRMAKIAGLNLQQKTTVNPSKRKHIEYLTFDKYGWIYCSSIKPKDIKERELWERSFQDNDYDHSSFIRRPLEFTLALGAMVVEQLGPQLSGVKSSIGFVDQDAVNIVTKGQMIAHGPVIYVEDPFETVSSASYRSDQVYLPYFVKSIEYKAQQEYRHIILAENEPSNEDEILKVSPAMIGTIRKHSSQNPTQQANGETFSASSSTEKANGSTLAYSSVRHEIKSGRHLADLNKQIAKSTFDPETPVSAKPSPESHKKLGGLAKTDVTSAALRALRSKVSPIIGNTPRTEVAAAAFHSEPCLLELCDVFENPFDNISIEDQDFIVVSISLPSADAISVKLIFSPTGTIALSIKKPNAQSLSFNYNSWLLAADSIIEKLESEGLSLRNPGLDD